MTIHKVGRLRGEKIREKDEIHYCIWHPWPGDDEDDENTGLCFDFDGGDIADLIALLEVLRHAEAGAYEEDDA